MNKLLFALKRVDITGHNSNIAIPLGKTVIGRGPFLQCADKKVSRNHAELELTNDGCLYITSVHVNPCFLNVEGGCEKTLEKHKQHKLEIGDKFSLLFNSFTYEVVPMTSIEDNKKGDGNELIEKSVESATGYLDKTCTIEKTMDSRSEEDNEVKVEGGTDMEEVNEDVSKRRTLPSWLLAAAINSEKPASDVKDDVGKGSKVRDKNAVPSASNRKKGVSRRRKDISSDENSEDEQDRQSKHLTADISNDEDNSVVSSSNPPTEVSQKNDDTPTSKKKDDAKTNSRRPCEFGKKCYRKNPAHFKECSHPGDNDYESDVSRDDSDDDRPECEFGTDCYRKNPQHIKEYKHTKRPKRKAAREAQKKAKNQRRDEEDDDNYDSSFINDDDSFDDSSYSPDEEDLKTLQNEAKKFIGNKKIHKMPS